LTYYVLRDSLGRVIESFGDKQTRTLFEDRLVPKFRSIERQARRRLLYLHQAKTLNDLAALPGSRLEKLSGDRRGQYSIRINDQWRVCLKWKDGRAHDVEITDYH
jgi:proteic killer suppression protein